MAMVPILLEMAERIFAVGAERKLSTQVRV